MRALDLSVSVIGLILLAPLFVAVAALVKLTSRGPVFYRAARIGEGGRRFCLYKFRTMIAGADKSGPGVTKNGDPRVTRFGRWLRSTKLDEIPQLFNVLVGDMSLVGPRPEDPRYVRCYTPDQLQVLRVKPGITSPATALYHHEDQILVGPNWEQTYLKEILPAKLRIELDYLPRRTFWTDLGLVANTLLLLLFRRQPRMR